MGKSNAKDAGAKGKGKGKAKDNADGKEEGKGKGLKPANSINVRHILADRLVGKSEEALMVSLKKRHTSWNPAPPRIQNGWK
ncbi:peptidyl-prolyl cis-trans isomerase pin4 [Emergomyces pasteurianus Ep9510]|uniref:Peptidyl-prolyl cis-trans isomerase pin4 n=1 Tax=Emergomyces pasteurianus Ep9510 TaxID=1447872 RepID=A0A1J9PFQ9_9EURO|nr:peptidyl-prolyl cis-trans isomerase pin4 [Emergomyces pasteurianus Ep9510]